MYRDDRPMSLELSGNVARIDWSNSFYVNAELLQFVLFVNSSAVYVGQKTSFTYHLPTTTTTTGTTCSHRVHHSEVVELERPKRESEL